MAKYTDVMDPELVGYVTEVAKSLRELRARQASYGELYIDSVTFGIGGEIINDIAVGQTEHDSLGVRITLTDYHKENN